MTNPKLLVAAAVAIGIIIVAVAIASFIYEADTLEIVAPQGAMRAERHPQLAT